MALVSVAMLKIRYIAVKGNFYCSENICSSLIFKHLREEKQLDDEEKVTWGLIAKGDKGQILQFYSK